MTSFELAQMNGVRENAIYWDGGLILSFSGVAIFESSEMVIIAEGIRADGNIPGSIKISTFNSWERVESLVYISVFGRHISLLDLRREKKHLEMYLRTLHNKNELSEYAEAYGRIKGWF
jgi:hypothetical protein